MLLQTADVKWFGFTRNVMTFATTAVRWSLYSTKSVLFFNLCMDSNTISCYLYCTCTAFHIIHVTNVTSVSHHVIIVTLYHKCHPGLFSISWVPPFITRFGIKMVRWKCSVSFDINEGKLYTPSSDGIPATETSLGTRIFCTCPRETQRWELVCGFIRSRTCGTSAVSSQVLRPSEKTFIFCVTLRKIPRLNLYTVFAPWHLSVFWRHRKCNWYVTCVTYVTLVLHMQFIIHQLRFISPVMVQPPVEKQFVILPRPRAGKSCLTCDAIDILERELASFVVRAFPTSQLQCRL